jgi:hypothetical protein
MIRRIWIAEVGVTASKKTKGGKPGRRLNRYGGEY